MWGVEVWLASAHFVKECSWQISEILMVDQDMQAALGVACYQERWALILESVGEMGPTTYFP